MYDKLIILTTIIYHLNFIYNFVIIILKNIHIKNKFML